MKIENKVHLEKVKESLHYMKVLQQNSSVMQPEIRLAICFSINMMENAIIEYETECDYKIFKEMEAKDGDGYMDLTDAEFEQWKENGLKKAEEDLQ